MSITIQINFVTNTFKKVMIINALGKRLDQNVDQKQTSQVLKTCEVYTFYHDYLDIFNVVLNSLILFCISLLSSNSNDFW